MKAKKLKKQDKSQLQIKEIKEKASELFGNRANHIKNMREAQSLKEIFIDAYILGYFDHALETFLEDELKR